MMADTMMNKPGLTYKTEYTDNYTWDAMRSAVSSRTKDASGLFRGIDDESQYNMYKTIADKHVTFAPPGGVTQESYPVDEGQGQVDPSVFPSELYPSVYRETVVHKDDRGQYIDPFKNIANKSYGRRLMYDPSHSDKMYPSMPSSELADHPGCYSFPTTTGLDPEIPFKRDLQWQGDGEIGQWPTDLWKGWTHTGVSPTYDGHDDQVEYSKYKVHLP